MERTKSKIEYDLGTINQKGSIKNFDFRYGTKISDMSVKMEALGL